MRVSMSFLSFVMTRLDTRFIRLTDIPALLRLEARQWDSHQAASAQDLQARIERHPNLCVGSFNCRTGEAVSSLFMRPLSREAILQAPTWADCANASQPAHRGPARTLFGISLTSIDPRGAQALIEFFWPHALKAGWREIYLGSPLPGFAAARRRDPQLTAARYAAQTRFGLPRDPQLRYYRHKGFREIVAVKPTYFPHDKSLDHGALLRGTVPLSRLAPLWRLLPWPVLRGLSSLAGAPT